MTGRNVVHGRRWFAGFLAAASMVWLGVPAAGKCDPPADTPIIGTPSDIGTGRIAYAKTRWDDSLAGLWVVDADGANRQRLADRGEYPVWSPDGRYIAYSGSGDDGGVWVMDVDGANPRLLAYRGVGPVWSPDGRYIAYTDWRDGDGGVWVVDADGANRRRLTDGWDPVWSPDGRRSLRGQVSGCAI